MTAVCDLLHTLKMNDTLLSPPYIASPCDQILHDPQRSVVVYGPQGSGKAAAMNFLQQRWRQQVLIVPWEPADPPFAKDENVLAAVHQSILAAVANQMVDELEGQPHVLGQLPLLCQEFLRWLLVQGLSARSLQVKQRLIPELRDLFDIQEQKDIYADHGGDSVRSQVDEMVVLAHELGYQRIFLFYQAAEFLPSPALQRLAALVGWRKLWQQRNFLFKAALHTAVVDQGQLIAKAQGRMEFHRLKWLAAEFRQAADAWIAAISQDAVPSLEAIAEPPILDAAANHLQDIRGEWLPADSKGLAELLLDLHTIRRRRLTYDQDGSELRRYVYRRLAPLRIAADGTGVCRGTRYIKVREQPLRVLDLLAQIHSGDTRQALLAVTGSQANLHKQISELRKAIEPVPTGSRDWVYICNSTEGNYVFEGRIEREGGQNWPARPP